MISCKDCSNFGERYDNCCPCKVSNRCLSMNGEEASTCPYYNIDLSDENICLNCKHFLGGGDWGLACTEHYNMLPQATDVACKDLEKK